VLKFVLFYKIYIDPRYTVSDNGSLLVATVTRHERALYTCIVKNKAGNDRKEIRVKIKTTPTVEPIIVNNGVIVLPTEYRNLSHCEQYDDIGLGTELKYVSHSPRLAWFSKPQLVAVAHDCVETRASYRIVLSCVAIGNPVPVITWTKDGDPLTTSVEVCSNCKAISFPNRLHLYGYLWLTLSFV